MIGLKKFIIEIFGQTGGILYCKNCFTLNFKPSMMTKIFSFRGAVMALEADQNCYYKG